MTSRCGGVGGSSGCSSDNCDFGGGGVVIVRSGGSGGHDNDNNDDSDSDDDDIDDENDQVPGQYTLVCAPPVVSPDTNNFQ